MRSRAPPVADAARRSTRSGRKNRASEQREDFFGHRKAVGADAPAATLGAYLCAVRTMLLHRSYPALQATERGLSRGNLSPLTRFCLLLAVQKEAPAGQAYSLCLCKRLRDADRRDEAIAIVCAGNPSGSFHSPPPFTQGRLLVGAMPKARRNYVVVCAGNPSASLTAASSPYTGEPFG